MSIVDGRQLYKSGPDYVLRKSSKGVAVNKGVARGSMGP